MKLRIFVGYVFLAILSCLTLYGLFWGIRDLSLTITQRAPYQVDLQNWNPAYARQRWVSVSGPLTIKEVKVKKQHNNSAIEVAVAPAGAKAGDPIHFVVVFLVKSDNLDTKLRAIAAGPILGMTESGTNVDDLTFRSSVAKDALVVQLDDKPPNAFLLVALIIVLLIMGNYVVMRFRLLRVYSRQLKCAPTT